MTTWLAGLIAGLLTATGGAVKDSRYEPFEWGKFARSVYIATAWGIFVSPELPFYAQVAVAFFCERATIEIWKAFIRTPKRPGKFKAGPQRDNLWVWRWLRNALSPLQ